MYIYIRVQICTCKTKLKEKYRERNGKRNNNQIIKYCTNCGLMDQIDERNAYTYMTVLKRRHILLISHSHFLNKTTTIIFFPQD